MNKFGEINFNLEDNIDRIIAEFDDTCMPLPDIEFEPHLLISKVRKHYMEYMIRLLSANYEKNQRLVNKNIYLPSAIWRCAKNIELKAAQTCMVVQLYRNHIVSVIKEVKKDTEKGRLNSRLYECLHRAPQNEKKVQTNPEIHCQCNITQNKRKKKTSPNINTQTDEPINDLNYNIPVLVNMQIDHNDTNQTIPNKTNIEIAEANSTTKITNTKNETDSDELMMQLQKLFQTDESPDDLFEGSFLENIDTEQKMIPDTSQKVDTQIALIENHDAQIKSLDERLATLSGLLTNMDSNTTLATQKAKLQKKRKCTSKWVCEEYFLKKDLYDLLYQIGDSNRGKLLRIKQIYIQLFGDDSDDEEDIVSPITDTTEFIESCKSRISTWVVTSLNPYYARGRIRGKALYKSLAKHLIELIYKCKQYPSQTEVTSFVLDFLESHDMIRCEADFKEFRINNIQPDYNFVF